MISNLKNWAEKVTNKNFTHKVELIFTLKLNNITHKV